jgi:acetyl esterase/lipase
MICAFTLNIWPGIAPGSENWKQEERVERGAVGNIVYNVVTPTLSVYLPEKAKAIGTGVIIAPGGAFMLLSIDHEGHDAAQWLHQKGIAVFVLKYRIAETAPGMSFGPPAAGRRAMMPEAPGSGAVNRNAGYNPSGNRPRIDMEASSRHGIADGIQALNIVRLHADEWGIDPNRVGFMGFSAGAMVAAGTLLQQNAGERPGFAALIYGCPFGTIPSITAGLPPIFLAWAQDDTLAGPSVVKFYDALLAAGNKPEAHIFGSGGHGFGMRKRGQSCDHWMESFYYWLEAQGFAKPETK